MIWLAVSVFASTVLLLVDRNRVWPAFWRFTKIAAVVIFGLSLLGAGYYGLQRHRADKYDALAAKYGGTEKPCDH